MPLKDTITKNGVDLNEIDVSQLALVDKTHLVEELSSKLKKGIEASFDDALESLDDKLKGHAAVGGSSAADLDSFSSAPRVRGGSTRMPRPQRYGNSDSGEAEVKKQQEEFEKLRKFKDRVERQIERAIARQRKFTKQQREQELRGKVYTSKGQSHAESIDDIIDQVHKVDTKELGKLKEQVAMLRKNIELDTRGEEQTLLTKHATQLEKALILETNQRRTTLGKIQQGFSKTAINVTSIIAGVSAHSPMIGLATKFILDKIRNEREAKQEEKNKKLRVGKKLVDTLPRKAETETDDKDLKFDTDNLRQTLQSTDDPDQRVALLQSLHKRGQISDEQHKALAEEFVPPHYTPLPDRIGRARAERNGQPVPMQPEPMSVPQKSETAPEENTVTMGNQTTSVPFDWQEHLKKPKKVREDEEKMAWVRQLAGMHEKKVEADHQKRLSNPLKPSDPSYDFMMDPDIVGKDVYYSRSKPRPASGGDPMVPKPEGPKIQTSPTSPAPMLQAALAQTGIVDHKETLDPERITAKELQVLHTDNSKLEKINEEQLDELRLMNKYLRQQIEQADLDSEARRRETKHAEGGPGGGMPQALLDETGKKKGEESGGLGGAVGNIAKEWLGLKIFGKGAGMFGKLGKNVLGKVPGLSKIPGLGKILGGGAEAVEGAAGAAGTVAEGGSLLSKIPGLGKILGGGAEAAGAGAKVGAKGLLGKAGGPIAAIMALIDGVQGYRGADKQTGIQASKLTTGDRTKSGVGSALGGFLGLPGDVLDMLGINPGEKSMFHVDNSDALKKTFTKGLFHATGNTKIEDEQKSQQDSKDQYAAAQKELQDAIDKKRLDNTGSGNKPPTIPSVGNSTLKSSPIPANPNPDAGGNSPQREGKIQYQNGVVPPEIAEMAAKTEKETGVPAAVTLAQWALESGWGKHSIGNNAFGITKAARHTKSQLKRTKEDMTVKEFAHLSPQEQASATEMDGSPLTMNWTGKKRIWVKRSFADFDSMQDSFTDHAKLLSSKTGPYAEAFARYKKTGDVNQFIQDISPTYASDRNYAPTITKLANQGTIMAAVNSNSPERVGSAPTVMASAAKPAPTAPVGISTPVKPTPTSGVTIAQASNLNNTMRQQAGTTTAAPNVIAPTTVNTNNNTSTTVVELTAKNNESTYQRTMNSMFVQT